MRLLFITQVFPNTANNMLSQQVRFLVRDGWDVNVVTGCSSILFGIDQREQSRAWPPVEFNQLGIDRVPSLAQGSNSIIVRLISDWSKAFTAFVTTILGWSADLVLVNGPPLVGPILARLVASRQRVPLVSVLYDIYPDIAIDGGHVKSPSVIAALRALEQIHYRAADKIIVPTSGFRRRLLRRGVTETCIELVPIWFDPFEVVPQPRSSDWLRIHGVGLDKKVVVYSGSIGLVSGAPVVAETANLLSKRQDIQFIVIGDGRLKSSLVKRVQELGLSNMLLLPRQPRTQLPRQLGAADVCLVTMGQHHGHTSFPSKILAYMAAGKPVVASVDIDCDIAREVEDHGFGLAVPPADPRTLADAIVELVDDEPRRQKMGKAARKRLETYYAQDIVLEKFEKVLRDVVAGRS